MMLSICCNSCYSKGEFSFALRRIIFTSLQLLLIYGAQTIVRRLRMKSDDLSESSKAIVGAVSVESVTPTPEVPGGPRSPLAKNVHQALRAQIVSGQLRPEQKLLGEHELAAAFLVSRPIVREAVRLLS